ncbi:MAG: ABC transporter ATP-binding protein [Nitriliruptorales bacterium]|nr:ABC transporter ATP-binding protein [Nitriliruptorales bacterium]
MTLETHVRVERPDLTVDVALSVDPGEVVAVMGPNGAGKSTLLAGIAGVGPLTRGFVRLGGTSLADVEGHTDLPAHERKIGIVFQQHRLFPHLSVLGNVAFGLRARGVSRSEAQVAATRWLERVGVADRAHVRPDQLSGGEAQRVALARTLVVEPEALLLDEPFAAADPSARSSLRSVLSEVLAESPRPTVVVTQDLVDAASLAARVVIVERGRVTHDSSLADIAMHPRTRWAAELVGVNLLRGQGHADVIDLADGGRIVAVEAPAGRCFVAIHPTAVALYPERPDGTPRNVWPLRIEALEPLGSRVRVALGGEIELVAEVTPAAITALGLREGRQVWAAVKATEITTYPA